MAEIPELDPQRELELNTNQRLTKWHDLIQVMVTIYGACNWSPLIG